VLFDDLKLPAPVKYGKGKTRSTAADILEALAPEHEIVRQVLEYRQLTKLKGTYVDALPALIDARTGRLHTSFNQAGAATGRLSSSNPNLQNIPMRTALGREIRAAFIPREGWKLLVADYSQIELRLLAHLSDDPLLVEAFRNGEDIHTRTASEVLGVPPMLVTPDARRDAKAVNFGIVYGISGFGLAQQLGIPRAEAEKYIKNYFARYAGVRAFIDRTIAEVRQTGVTRTCSAASGPSPTSTAAMPTPADSPSGPPSIRRCRAPPPTSSSSPWCASIASSPNRRRLPQRHAAAGARRTGVRVSAGGIADHQRSRSW
jgi:DNA polymerase I